MNYSIIKRILLLAVAAGFLFSCSGGKRAWKPGKPFPKDSIQVGIIYVSDPFYETVGYSWMHRIGMEKTRQETGLREDQVIHLANVFDIDAEGTESAIRDLIAQGCNIIIATSWGYMDSCERLAAEFPGVIFAHATGNKHNSRNFTNYFGRIEEARYLSGLAAGLQTQTGKIGYVAAMGTESAEVTGGINAFAIGVEQVNAQAKVYVKVTRSWYDPMAEANAARDLIDLGCDVIAQHCDTAFPQEEAEKAHVWGIGYNNDMYAAAPGAVITSVVWNWDVYYTRLVKSVIDGSFTTEPYFGGMADGMVDISSLSEKAAPGIAEQIAAGRERIVSGNFKVFGTDEREIIEGIDRYHHTIIGP